MRITTWILALVSSIGLMTNAKADDAKPWTFWYWMNGAVTREGITADLEAMAEIGLEGCYLMPIYGIERAPQLGGTIRQGTPEWWQMVDFALHEADRLELKIGMHICDGFALAGGPWITPAQSMQQVVSTDTILSVTNAKGLKWSCSMRPAAPKGFYKDIATYAIPLSYQPQDSKLKPIIASDNKAFTIDAKGRLKCKEACRFTYSYAQPVTVSALRITTYNNSLQALRMKVYALTEEGNMQLIKEMVPPRHGWQNYDSPTTVALPTVTTRQLMFEWTPEGSEKGCEDLDNGKWGKVLKIEKMEVLATPRVDDWEGKCGRVWRVSSQQQSVTSPQMYVPLNKVIRLKEGVTLPQGDWRIVRIGHASTLHENATGGSCKGLECDKFSRRAVQCQLDNWFGAAFKNCDTEVAHRVLKYMHIDSWECGSQNWSDFIETSAGGTETFAQYFSRQHGYDLMTYLPLMVGIPMVDQETSERVLRDVRNSIAELVDEEFYPTLVKEARKQGCQLSAESVAPTMISDGMQHYRHADIPMGEFWLNSPTHDKPNDMLDAISGGHIWGKQIIQAEGFTQLRGLFSETPAQLKPLLDKQYCLGINRLFFHVYALNPDPQKKPGMTLDGIGLFFQRTQPWWKEGKAFVDYITRCQRLLQQGRPIVDVAVYTGHEMPRRAVLPDRLKPLPGYLYDSYNFGALLEPVKSPYRPRYKVFVLPGARKMDPDNQPLTDAAKQGIEHLKSLRLKIIEGVPTAQQLKDLGILPDVLCPEDILFTHRMLDNGDIYFLSNQKGEERQVEVSFRDHRNRPGIVYDAVTDTHVPLNGVKNNAEGDYITSTITLPAYGSCFVLFGLREGKAAKAVETKNVVAMNRTTPYHLLFVENGKSIQSDTLPDWSKLEGDSLQYYSGRVRYTFSFKYKPRRNEMGRVFLVLDDLHDVASVCLNGVPCGSIWTAPYEIDITDALQHGNNLMELWVANSWNNAILGNDTGHAPFGDIWTNAKYRDPNAKLLPAGVGKLRLEAR